MGWGCEPIEAQPGTEFEIGEAELAGQEALIEIRARAWAARLIFVKPIGPPRSSLLHFLHRHPDGSGMWQWLSPHGETLPAQEKPITMTLLSSASDIRQSQPPSC